MIDPDDAATAERILRRALASATTLHGFQRALAAIAAMDSIDSVDAAAALELFDACGAIKLECGVISVRDPLDYLWKLGEADKDAALSLAESERLEAEREAAAERPPYTWDARNL